MRAGPVAELPRVFSCVAFALIRLINLESYLDFLNAFRMRAILTLLGIRTSRKKPKRQNEFPSIDLSDEFLKKTGTFSKLGKI